MVLTMFQQSKSDMLLVLLLLLTFFLSGSTCIICANLSVHVSVNVFQ